MLKLAVEKEFLQVVDDQVGCPTYTIDLANAVIENLITSNSDSGIYHLVNSGHTSFYSYALNIFEQANLDVDVRPITAKEYARPALRPAVSILKNTKVKELRHWYEALTDYLKMYCDI